MLNEEECNINKKPPNSILLVANFRSGVGYAWWLMENFWAEISSLFSSNDANAILIYPEIDDIPQIILKSPIIVKEHDFSDRSLTNLKKLRKIIQNYNIEYIYLTDRPYYDWLYFLLRRWGVTKIINHDHMPGERGSLPITKKYLKIIIHKVAFSSCDRYIGVSKFVRDRFVNTGCIPRERCSYVLNGINPIERDPAASQYVTNHFNIPCNSYVVVTCSRATRYKGLDILIHAANTLINEMGRDDVCFLHIGDGPHLNEFRKMVTEFSLDENVVFAGQRHDVRKILPCCHFGLQTSRGEAFSLAILEYMSAGLLTIAPNHCGNAEAIEHGITGILYKAGDYREIARTIQLFLNEGDERKRIGLRAAQSVEISFNLRRTNRELIGLIDRELTT